MPREGYITASAIASAIGLNPYESRQECARILLGLKTKEPFAAGEWGNDQEDLTIRSYEAVTGNLVVGEQSWFESGHIGCHVDGLVLDGKTRLIVEVKSPVSIESFEKNYQEPPAYYMPQVQVQMWLAKASLCHFVARFADQVRVWTVDPHSKYLAIVRSELDWFWKHIQDGVVPPRRKKPEMPALQITQIHNGEIG